VAALRRAAAGAGGLPTRKQVVQAVAATKNYRGTTGAFSFTAAGDAVQPTLAVWKTSNGAWVFDTQFAEARKAG